MLLLVLVREAQHEIGKRKVFWQVFEVLSQPRVHAFRESLPKPGEEKKKLD